MSPAFAVQKLWSQEKSRFVLALSPVPGTGGNLPKKVFLSIHGDHAPAVLLLEDKPDPLHPDHPLVELFRKYVLPCRLTHVYSLPTEKGYGLQFQGVRENGLATGYLLVIGGNPWSIELVWEDRSLCRITSAGVFTKGKPWTQSPSLSEAVAKAEGMTIEALLGGRDVAAVADNLSKDPADKVNTDGLTGLSEEQRSLRDRLARRTKTVRKSLERLRRELPPETAAAAMRERGERLTALAPHWQGGGDTITIPVSLPPLSDGSRVIFLDPDRSLGQEIEYSFSEGKRLVRARLKGLEMIKQAEETFRQCEGDLKDLRARILDRDSLMVIGKRHKLTSDSAHSPRSTTPKVESGEAKPWRMFSLEPRGGGYEALVGKSAAGNDELHRHSRSNDWFLHVVSPQGSHVIIPAKGKREAPPEKTIREAAILALHFSKVRQDHGGEVYFTQRMHTLKRKGLAEGLVLIQRSSVLNVKYELIELSAIMEREIFL